MKDKGRKILELAVQTDPERTRSFESAAGMVKMIPFEGVIAGGIMTGTVEPFGVDTQITNQNGVRHMSARYMLSGCDEYGEPCHIYVENNAWFSDGEHPKPFRTVPTFITDSKRLAPYLERNAFIGEGLRQEDGLHICFYEMAGDSDDH